MLSSRATHWLYHSGFFEPVPEPDLGGMGSIHAPRSVNGELMMLRFGSLGALWLIRHEY